MTQDSDDVTVRLTKVEYGESSASVTFELNEPSTRFSLYAIDDVRYTQGYRADHIELQAHEQLSDHLSAFAHELRQIVDELKA